VTHWLFDLSTGLFTGRSMSASPEFLEANRPDGYEWIDGVIDPQSQRVDLKDRLIVDYQPPPPSDDHEWIPERKRYRLKPEVAQAQARRAAAVNEIEQLERASLRPLREVRLAELDGRAVPDQARARLVEIETRIAELRADLAPVPGVLPRQSLKAI
jgi:hypothetical protein